MKLTPWLLLTASASTGCIAYTHRIDVAVRDPSAVWIERSSEARVEVERDPDGALRVDGRTVVGSEGVISPSPRDMPQTEGDGVLRVGICHRGRFGVGCMRAARLATPMTNVRLLREEDVPSRESGVLELLLGGGLISGGVLARDRYSSGGELLIGAGALTVLLGIVQLVLPAKNESVVVAP